MRKGKDKPLWNLNDFINESTIICYWVQLQTAYKVDYTNLLIYSKKYCFHFVVLIKLGTRIPILLAARCWQSKVGKEEQRKNGLNWVKPSPLLAPSLFSLSPLSLSPSLIILSPLIPLSISGKVHNYYPAHILAGNDEGKEITLNFSLNPLSYVSLSLKDFRR